MLGSFFFEKLHAGFLKTPKNDIGMWGLYSAIIHDFNTFLCILSQINIHQHRIHHHIHAKTSTKV